MSIPSEAIEAAAKAMAQIETGNDGITVANEIDRLHARAALEAAAPYLMATVMALHSPVAWKPGSPRPAGIDTVCANCGTAYPCATVEAATGDANV
jgi:hypothetical protein